MRTISAWSIVVGALGLFAAPASAGPEQLAAIERECLRQMRLSASACTCMRGQAGRLKDGQQAFIIAAMTKDQAAQTRLRGDLTVNELTEVAVFMGNVPTQCARQ